VTDDFIIVSLFGTDHPRVRRRPTFALQLIDLDNDFVEHSLYGIDARRRQVTEVGFADAVAGAGVLAMGEAAEGRPAALVRGLDWSAEPRPAAALVRPRSEDLFR